MSPRFVPIGDLCAVIGGGTPTRNVAEYYGGSIPWVTPKDMKTWEIHGAQVNITEAGLQNSATNLVPPNSVLVVVRSGVLKHTVPVAISRVPVTINQDMKALLCSESADPGYVARFVKARSSVVLQWVRATTADNFPIDKLKRLEIPLPPLPEQRRIAAILDKADALRAKRRAALSQLDTLTQSIFLDMFGDPATNPKRWAIAPMCGLFASAPIFGTMIPPAPDSGSWLSLRVANIQNWDLDLSDKKFVELPPATVDRHSLRDGDLVLARAIASEAHLGKAIVVYPGARRWAFDSHLMRLRFDREQVEPEFVRHMFRSEGGRRLFLGVTRRSAVQFNVNTKEIAGLRLPVPPVSLQRKFTVSVGAVTKAKFAHGASLAGIDALFASLQHRAFRGEL